MSHYLVDTHNPSFPSARIVDVVEAPAGTSPMNGGGVIRVPDYIQVQDPSDTPDLITKKYAGLLAYYAGFSYITYDDFLDVAGIDLTAPLLRGIFGDRGAVSIFDVGSAGALFSTTSVLSGAAPTQAIITWETYSVAVSDLALARLQRTYTEEPAGDLTCEVSFDNGVNWYTVIDGAVFSIPVIGQGTDFKIRFTNTVGSRRYLGSWAVIY